MFERLARVRLADALLPLLLLTVTTTGCASTGPAGENPAPQAAAAPPRPATINHVVFFKLKDAADAPALISDCDERLATIPGITSYYCGQHVDVGRGTVIDDYDVGFFVGFATVEDYLGYVDHPQHLAVVQDWRPRFEWLKVYDVQDVTP